MEESNITSEILPTEQESIVNEGSSDERESTITYGTGDGEEASLMQSEQSAIEQESTIANTSDTIGADSSIHKVTQVDDLNVGHDATIGGTLKAYKESLPKSGLPVKDGTGIYSDGAAYAYTPTQIEKDTTNISLGVLGLRLLNAAGVAVGGWTDIPVGISDKDRAGIDADMSQLLAAISGRYLRKDSPDTAQGVITFLKGLTSQELVTLMKGIAIGTSYGINAEGVARLKALLLDKASIDAEGNALVGSVKSADYHAGLLDGSGFGMYKEEDSGNTVVEVDKLNVRKKAVFAKLDVREFAFTSGDVAYTSAGCKIERVTQLANGDYRCYWLAEQDGVKIENAWHVGDQAMARTANIISRDTSMAANRYYWRLVVGKGEEMIDGKMYHYIDLSDTRGTLTLTTDGQEHTCVGCDTSVENDAPQAEDSIVQMGSQTDENRQYAYVVYVSEGKRVDYDGISGYDLDSHIVEIHSREVNYMRSERFELVTGGNIHVPLVTERGAWVDGTTAYHYDHFSYNNATWLCIVGKGQSTTEAPNEESGKWVKETYGADGKDGASSYVHLRYSDDGGETFTPASQSAIDAIPLEGKNLWNMDSMFEEEGVDGVFAEVDKPTSSFTVNVSLESGKIGDFGIGGVLIGSQSLGVRTLTMSGYLTSSVDTTLTVWDTPITLTANVKKYITVTVENYYDYNDRIMFDHSTEGAFTVKFERMKIEVGDVATDYTPSPAYITMGTTEGKWMGTAVWDKPYPPASVSAYTWVRVTGRSIVSVDVVYQVTNSNTEAPTSWVTDQPHLAEGTWLWQATLITYDDDTKDYVGASCITSADQVREVIEQYASNQSNVNAPASGWQDTISGLQTGSGWYVWTRSKITYQDGSVRYTEPVCATGEAGASYKGVRLTTTSTVVSLDKDGLVTAPSSIIIRADVQGVTGTPSWDIYNENGINTQGITGTKSNKDKTLTLNIGQLRLAFETGGWKSMRVACTVGSYSDYITIVPNKDGAQGRGIASVTEYYQVSSLNTVAPTTWQTTPPPMTATNKYLWNYEVITYTSGDPTQTTPHVVGMYGEGRGIVSVTNYYLATSLASGVTTDTQGWSTDVASQQLTPTNKYLWNYEETQYTSGDPTTIAPHIIGTYGKDGAPGADAVTVRLVPDRIVVDTDNTGHVTATQLTNAYTTVEVRKGATAYASFTIGTPTTSSDIGCSVNNPKVKVTSINDDQSTGYAYGSGYIDIPVTVDGVVYTVRLTVETNIHKVVADFKKTTDSLTLYVNTYTQTVDGYKEETDSRLTVAERKINTNVTAVDNLGMRMSNVEQTADSISMKVSEKMLAGNMLVGTMFRRESEFEWNNPAYKGVISTAVQLGGVNSVYLESSSTTQVWKGVIWRKIPVTAGKTYNMSFWYRTPDVASNGQFVIEVQAFKADGTQAENFRPLVNWALPIPANDTWKLYSADMTLGNDVAAVDVLIYLTTKGKMYIARPMLIEGSYVGWQRSEQDYDYIGGNLLDETKTLTKRGNLVGINGTVTGNAFGVCSSVHANPTTEYTNILTWRFDYDLNADYTLSFMAKGTGNLDVYLFNDNFDVSLLSEVSGQQRNTEDGNATIVLTPEWKRHTVRWRTKSARTWAWSYLQMRVFAVSEAYIAQPKLEKGCIATAWTDGDGDMVSTKALLATGIDIENRKVTITSDNVEVRNNSGETTALLDETGKIQTNLVVASVIRTGNIGQPHVEAKGSEFKIFGYNVFPFIELAWREDVGSVLRFNDEKTGQALYDLGPGGILDNISTVLDKWTIMPLKSLTTSSRLSAILDVTENDCTKYNQFVEGYEQMGSVKKYNVSKTSSPSVYSGKMYVQQSYNSAVIPDGWYVGVNNGNYLASATESMDSSSTPLYRCNLLLVSGGKVTNSAFCYFTEAMKEYQVAVRTVGCNTNGIELNQATYPYLWSYGVGIPSQE